MIRVGVDLVSVERIRRALSDWPRLEQRLFTEDEVRYARSRPDPLQHLAGRFAAKEAAFKALGQGWPRLSWRDVEVLSQEGRPVLRLSGRAAGLLGEAQAALSISHDGGYAVAQVVLLSVPGG